MGRDISHLWNISIILQSDNIFSILDEEPVDGGCSDDDDDDGDDDDDFN